MHVRCVLPLFLSLSVRVQGGAYGAFLDYDLASGQLSYCSYRDPGLLSTLDDFDSEPSCVRRSA